MQQSEILLESGTNEVEVLEFIIDGNSYGINVLKVKQLVAHSSELLRHVPDSHPAVMGVMVFQDVPTTVVNLQKFFHDYSEIFSSFQSLSGEFVTSSGMTLAEDRKVIIFCEFNNVMTGFIVDGLDRIHRISWKDIQAPNSVVEKYETLITGIYSVDGREILLLDLESILAKILPIQAIGKQSNEDEEDIEAANDTGSKKRPRSEINVYLADDSSIIREKLRFVMKKIGYEKSVFFTNGEEAFEKISASVEQSKAEGKSLSEFIDILVTDIEMPKMDGLTLCKNVKHIAPNLPVIVFSSLVTDQIAHKCEAVGADAFMSKRDISTLVRSMNELS